MFRQDSYPSGIFLFKEKIGEGKIKNKEKKGRRLNRSMFFNPRLIFTF